MNAGELKAIVDDFVQIRDAIKPKLYGWDCYHALMNHAESIASRIIAAKIVNGDYKGRNYYRSKNNADL